jgi:hypothetical protein
LLKRHGTKTTNGQGNGVQAIMERLHAVQRERASRAGGDQ